MNLKTSALLIAANVLLSALVVLAYALWFAPAAAPRLAVLDVGELYRLKETQVAKVLVKLDATHEDRALALQRASAFGLEMTNLIQSLPEECHCLILARGAVVGSGPAAARSDAGSASAPWAVGGAMCYLVCKPTMFKRFNRESFQRRLSDHVRRWGIAYLLLIVAAVLIQAHYAVGLNVSPSLPQRFFLIHKGELPLRGQYVAFRWPCDQLEDPKLTKTIVARGVTELVTPGMSFSEQVVDRRDNHWLAAICGGNGSYGVAFLDVTTGEFLVAEEDADAAMKLLDGHAPRELLFPKGLRDAFIESTSARLHSYALDDWAFADEFARERLLAQIGTSSLKGFGIDHLRLGQRAAGAILHYLGEARHDRLAHIASVRWIRPSVHVGLDRFTIRNLDAEGPIRDALGSVRKNNAPFGLVIKKGTFTTFAGDTRKSSAFEMTREAAIQQVLEFLDERDVVVSTTGMASREVYEYRVRAGEGHERDLLTVGGMGHASQIALGVALQRPDRVVYCLDGDGALLMHMGALPITGVLKPGNFKHIVLNNGAHDSVGGQPTVGFNIDILGIARACSYRMVVHAQTPQELQSCLQELKRSKGPCLLEIRIRCGARKDLGRPATAPVENKHAFMDFIQS